MKLQLFISTIVLCFSLVATPVFAESNRDNLRQELEKQEQILEEEMKPINPLDEDITKSLYEKALNDLEETAKNSTGELDIKSKSDAFQRLIFRLVINSRTIAIYAYIAIWVAGILYAATFGSRDVNKRRKVYLIIRNSTVLFLTYINIPLFIIWLNADKSQLSSVTAFNVVYDILEFLQSNSLVISSLMAYAGVTRIIISKNDLPMRRQGIYLTKFSVVVLLLLNIAPMAMYFLI